MLRRDDRVLPTELQHQLLRAHDQLLRSDVHSRICTCLHGGLRAGLHELLLRCVFELLRSGHIQQLLRWRMVSGLLGRSRSHAIVGLDRLRRRLPSHLWLHRRLRTEHLLIVPGWLCSKLRSSVLDLLKLLFVCVAMQHMCSVRTESMFNVLDLHRRI